MTDQKHNPVDHLVGRRVPREGTITRIVHDELLANPGWWIRPSVRVKSQSLVDRLLVTYGMEVECSGKTGKGGFAKWRLSAEHREDGYVSHVATGGPS